MDVTALVRIDCPAGFTAASRPALRAFLAAVRHVRTLPGFRRWQTFRTLDAPDALLVTVDWDSPESLTQALAEAETQRRIIEAAELGFTVAPIEPLPAVFDRCLAGSEGRATLLRVVAYSEPQSKPGSRDSEFALRALAVPGTTRLWGGNAADGSRAICRIDFDTEDGMWHFLDSPLRHAWGGKSAAGRVDESWAINLPALDYQRDGGRHALRMRPMKRHSTLSVHVETGTDGRMARLQFQGRLDAAGSLRCEKMCHALIARGYRRLVIDLSGLSLVSEEALAMLTRTARHLKERAGEFVLIDNEARVRRVTRSKHLANSLG